MSNEKNILNLNNTLNIAEKSLFILDEQGEQLINVNSKLDEIDNNLSYSNYLLKKIKSIFYNKYFFNEKQYLKNKIKNNEDILLEQNNIEIINNESILLNKNKQNIEDNLINKLNILKEINLKISDVLDFQNNLINNLNDKTDNTDLEMNSVNNNLNELI